MALSPEPGAAIPVAGTRNLRDLGGWPCAGGLVRRGMCYRGDAWHGLKAEGLVQAAGLGIRTVLDFRTGEEIAAAPDHLPQPRPRWLHLPAFGANPIGNNLFFLFRLRGRFDAWLVDSYLRILDERSAFFRDLFELLAVPEHYPVLMHCTAGKDRTGLASALLLLVLGVPEATVVEEYALTNRATAAWLDRHPRLLGFTAWFGLGRAAVSPLLEARPAYLQAALAHLKERWGSAEGYLLAAGLKPATLAAIRALLVEPAPPNRSPQAVTLEVPGVNP